MNPFKPRLNIDGISVEGREANRILKQAMAEDRRNNPLSRKKWIQTIVGAVGFLVIAVAIIIVIQQYTFRLPPYLFIYLSIPFGLFQGLLFGGGIALIFKWGQRKQLRRAMFHLGYDLCTNCGYWLKGLDETIEKCPECGSEREPMPEQKVGMSK